VAGPKFIVVVAVAVMVAAFCTVVDGDNCGCDDGEGGGERTNDVVILKDDGGR